MGKHSCGEENPHHVSERSREGSCEFQGDVVVGDPRQRKPQRSVCRLLLRAKTPLSLFDRLLRVRNRKREISSKLSSTWQKLSQLSIIALSPRSSNLVEGGKALLFLLPPPLFQPSRTRKLERFICGGQRLRGRKEGGAEKCRTCKEMCAEFVCVCAVCGSVCSTTLKLCVSHTLCIIITTKARKKIFLLPVNMLVSP